MAVRSCPPSSASTTRPPASIISCFVKWPKPGRHQRRGGVTSGSAEVPTLGIPPGTPPLTFGSDGVATEWGEVTLDSVEAG